jgi:hypothetical protein
VKSADINRGMLEKALKDRIKFDINEQKKLILDRDYYTCQKCGKKAVYLAHRIAQTKSNLKIFGEEIIHHSANLVSVCENQSCNDYYNIGYNIGKTKKLLNFIKENKNKIILDISEIDEILE